MELGLIGLGRMGINMSRRLLRAGHTTVGYARHWDTVQGYLNDKSISKGAHSLEEVVSQLSTPRAVWLM
ncbi:MAG TPA: NAD(P)-binding domain-containing protein, partial [Ktedonobacteraceae bacterium]|nr:NAD(P)-binding domain-containing protein [Ktedonobacteraceae bacterium]